MNNFIVTKADVMANNGVIHFIDHLLKLPNTYLLEQKKNRIKELRKFVENSLHDSKIDSDFFTSESEESIENDEKNANYNYESDDSDTVNPDCEVQEVWFNCTIHEFSLTELILTDFIYLFQTEEEKEEI